MTEFDVESLKTVDFAALRAKLESEGVTGQLWDVTFAPAVAKNFDSRYPNLGGRVVIDVRGRFYPMEHVWTSVLQKIYTDENGRTFAKTYYSLYELMDFDPQEIPEDYLYAFS